MAAPPASSSPPAPPRRPPRVAASTRCAASSSALWAHLRMALLRQLSTLGVSLLVPGGWRIACSMPLQADFSSRNSKFGVQYGYPVTAADGLREVALMADELSGPPVVVVAMKGHPGSGKSTAARAIAAALRCPLLDKDDVRDCTRPLEGLAPAGVLNELSYAVLWRVAKRQVQLGLSIVVDSPLSRRTHLDALASLPGALVVIVECRPGDEEEWHRRLEKRGVADSGGDGWHKPKTWGELSSLVEGYQGCTDYEIGDVPRIVVDTTDPTVDAEAIAAKVLAFVKSLCS